MVYITVLEMVDRFKRKLQTIFYTKHLDMLQANCEIRHFVKCLKIPGISSNAWYFMKCLNWILQTFLACLLLLQVLDKPV